MQSLVVDDFQSKYDFYAFVNAVITRLMKKQCELFDEEMTKIYRETIELTNSHTLNGNVKYRVPKKAPVVIRLKKSTKPGHFFALNPVIDILLKLPVKGKFRTLSLSKIGKNEQGYTSHNIIENSLFIVREEYRDMLIKHINQINLLNDFSLFVNKIITSLNVAALTFISPDFNFEGSELKISRIRKLFQKDLVGVIEYLASEIFLHQKFYIEELFELIIYIKSEFEEETKLLITAENIKRKRESNIRARTKYIPILNPIRVTLQKGPMFSIQLPAGEGYLMNMFPSIRVKSSIKLCNSVSLDVQSNNIKSKHATHNLVKFDLASGKKGLVPELVLYNRFESVPECLFNSVELMMNKIDVLTELKSIAFEQQHELAVVAMRVSKNSNAKRHE